jgi:hypothetical protein
VEEDETGRTFDAASSPALTHPPFIPRSRWRSERTQERERDTRGRTGSGRKERGGANEDSARETEVRECVECVPPFLYASHFLRLNETRKRKKETIKKRSDFKESARARAERGRPEGVSSPL